MSEPRDRHLEKARSLVSPYLNDFGDAGALEQLILDIAHALAEAEDIHLMDAPEFGTD